MFSVSSVVVLTGDEICQPKVFGLSELLEIVYLKDFEQVLRGCLKSHTPRRRDVNSYKILKIKDQV